MTKEPREADGISRRGLLLSSTALAGAAAVVRPSTAPASIAARARTVRRGRAIAVRGRRVVVAHDQRRTIASGGRLIDVGGEPLDVAISADGRVAAVTTAAWDAPALVVVDLVRGRVLHRIEVGPAPRAVAFTGTRRVVVTGGEQEGGVWIVDVSHAKVLAHAAVGRCPRDDVTAPGGDAAWVALNADDRVVKVSARTGRVRRTLRTPALPDRLALSKDGRRLLVTHGGREAELVSEIDVRSKRLTRHRAGAFPSGVAFTATGRRLVTLGGEGAVLTIGRGRQRVGGAPRGLTVAGRRAFTVDGLTGEIAQVKA